MIRPDIHAVRSYLMDLQDRICAALEHEDGEVRFSEQVLPGESDTLARPRVLEGGPVIEKSAVHFTHARGPRLPPAATEHRPELAGHGFHAVSLSLIVHPRNPYAPTSHMNVRCFLAEREGAAPAWWIGGGFDLTPYYGFEADCVHWHRTAKAACDPFGAELYPRFKKACDDYFYLPHRGEPRGIGGLFFDDLDLGGFATTFGFLRSVGDHYVPAYQPVLARRKALPYTDRERAFQLYRRGRYVEFNLLYDRGTRYGLQSGRRIESVLASLPPLVAWRYDYTPRAGSPESDLARLLSPRDWV
jgi:coproporphyrinogen III oxidase